MEMEQKKPLKSGNKAVINYEKCKPDDCLKCVKTCKLEALLKDGGCYPIINLDECFGCGDCADECPNEAIAIKWLDGTQPDQPRSKFATW